MLFMLLNILPHVLPQIFFPHFPALKPRCVLWSEKYGAHMFVVMPAKQTCCAASH